MFQGSFTIQSAADVATIAPYCEITGDLTMSAAGLATIALPALRKVGGHIGVDCPNLASLDLGALAEVGSVDVINTVLTTMNVDSLATLGGDFRLGLHLLTKLALPELTTAPGALMLNGPVLKTVALPKLTDVGGDPGTGVGIIVGGPLTSLDLGVLATVTQSVTIMGGSGSVSLPALATVGTDLTVSTSGSASVPLIKQVRELRISGSSLFSAPALQTVTSDLVATNLAAVDLGALTSVGGNLQLSGAGLTAFPAPKLATIGGGLAVASTKLAALDFPALTSIGAATNPNYALDFDPVAAAMDCAPQNANPQLTQLKLPLLASLGPTNATPIRLGDHPLLPQCRIDALVAQLGQHGWTGVVTNKQSSNPSCHVASGPCP